MLLIRGGAGFDQKSHFCNHYAKTAPLQRIRGHTEGSSFVEGEDGGCDLGAEEQVQSTVTIVTVRAWSRSDSGILLFQHYEAPSTFCISLTLTVLPLYTQKVNKYFSSSFHHITVT